MPTGKILQFALASALLSAVGGVALAQPAGPVPPTFEVMTLPGSDRTVVVGTAEPGATIDILDRNLPIAVAVANRRGEWAIALGDDLAPGNHRFSVRATSPDGRQVLIASQRIEITVPEPQQAVAAESGDEIVVRSGDNLWNLARRLYGSGVYFSLLFEANRDIVDSPAAIFPGQVLAVPPLPAPSEGDTGPTEN